MASIFFFFAAAHEKITLLWLITICSTVQNHKCFLYVNVKQKPVFYTNNGGVGPPPFVLKQRSRFMHKSFTFIQAQDE